MTKNWPTFSNVVSAYRACRLGKPASIHQTKFEVYLGLNLLKLHSDLITLKYKPSSMICFIVTHPKPREIFAAHFRDRIVHHLLVKKLTPAWERKFIYSSFACRLNKGPTGALAYFRKQVQRISQGGLRPVYTLQIDIASFFVTIHRPTLCRLLAKGKKEGLEKHLIETLYLADGRKEVIKKGPAELFNLIPKEKSWFNQEKNSGIPIGNLISQFGANVYLTELDHFILRTLKPLGYLRYMDDLTLIDSNPERLKPFEKQIDTWLKTNRYQSLNLAKTRLSRLDTEKIEYLGYQCLQTNFPAEPLELFLKPEKKWKWIKTLRNMSKIDFQSFQNSNPLGPKLESEEVKHALAQVNSRLGNLKHAKTFRLRKQSLEKLIQETSENRDLPLELGGPFFPLKAREDYLAINRR